MKRAVLYARVSTNDQHLETQLLDLREMAKQRGHEVVREYTDTSAEQNRSDPDSTSFWPMRGGTALTSCSSARSTASPETCAISWKCSTN